jgi:hypothetical protein
MAQGYEGMSLSPIDLNGKKGRRVGGLKFPLLRGNPGQMRE